MFAMCPRIPATARPQSARIFPVSSEASVKICLWFIYFVDIKWNFNYSKFAMTRHGRGESFICPVRICRVIEYAGLYLNLLFSFGFRDNSAIENSHLIEWIPQTINDRSRAELKLFGKKTGRLKIPQPNKSQ